MIQYWNYLREYKNLKKNILNSVDKIFQSGTLLLGNELKKFEKKFIKFHRFKYGLYQKYWILQKSPKIVFL